MYGWAANQVVNYEIVSNADFFWALKGGSNNFGIVTRFDLRTFFEALVFAGTNTYDTPYYPQFLEALSSYLAPTGGIKDAKSALVPAVFVFPRTGVQGNAVVFYDDDDDDDALEATFSSRKKVTVNSVASTGTHSRQCKGERLE